MLKLEAKGRNSRQRIKAGCQLMRGRKGAASRIYFTEEPRVAASRSETFCFRVDSALERFGNGWGGDQGVQSCFLTDFSNTAAHFYFVAASSDSQGLFLFLAGGVLVCVCVCTISCQISVLLLSSTCNHTRRYCLYLHLSRDSTPCFPNLCPCPCPEGLPGKTVSPLPARRSPGLFPPSWYKAPEGFHSLKWAFIYYCSFVYSLVERALHLPGERSIPFLLP